jgi:hypothetical protein
MISLILIITLQTWSNTSQPLRQEWLVRMSHWLLDYLEHKIGLGCLRWWYMESLHIGSSFLVFTCDWKIRCFPQWV